MVTEFTLLKSVTNLLGPSGLAAGYNIQQTAIRRPTSNDIKNTKCFSEFYPRNYEARVLPMCLNSSLNAESGQAYNAGLTWPSTYKAILLGYPCLFRICGYLRFLS